MRCHVVPINSVKACKLLHNPADMSEYPNASDRNFVSMYVLDTCLALVNWCVLNIAFDTHVGSIPDITVKYLFLLDSEYHHKIIMIYIQYCIFKSDFF